MSLIINSDTGFLDKVYLSVVPTTSMETQFFTVSALISSGILIGVRFGHLKKHAILLSSITALTTYAFQKISNFTEESSSFGTQKNCTFAYLLITLGIIAFSKKVLAPILPSPHTAPS